MQKKAEKTPSESSNMTVLAHQQFIACGSNQSVFILWYQYVPPLGISIFFFHDAMVNYSGKLLTYGTF